MNIDLNKTTEFGALDLTVFNKGKAGIVEGVMVRVEKRKASDKKEAPDFKLIASDGLGEVNEGFYYQEDNQNGTAVENFKKFQAQRLIRLAKGIFGEDYKFAEYDTPSQALEDILKTVNSAIKGKTCRVVVAYGTTKRPQRYLRFKSFGRFIELEEEYPVSSLTLDTSDLIERPEATPTEESELIKSETTNETITKSAEEPDWLK